MTGPWIGRAVLALLLGAAWFGSPQPDPSAVRRERAYRASNIGVAQLEQFDYDAAAASFRQALAIDDGLGVAHLNLAIALFYGGHADTAQAEARAAAAALPAYPHPHYLLGLIARADNRPDDAVAAFESVLQIDASDAGAKINLGQIRLQQRRYGDALRLFREAAAAEPFNATAAFGVATALNRSGEGDPGNAAMSRFQTLRDSAYAVTYAQGYLQQGRYAEAIASTGAEADLVDPASPAVVFTDATSAALGSAARGARSVLLFDADSDGGLDLLAPGAEGVRLFRNAAGRFTDATTAAQLGGAPAIAAVAGDYDNDGRPDLLILRDAAVALLHQRADGRFEPAPGSSTLAAAGLRARAAAWVDVDHDGDLDAVIGPRLFRNNGNATFTDITAAAGLGGADVPAAIVPTDYDNRRDVDLLLASDRMAPRLFRNMRDGTFRDAAADADLPHDRGVTAVAAADLNKDGFTDFFFGLGAGPGVLALSDGHGRFVTRPAPDGSAGATGAQFWDYDNDGLLDLLVISPVGPRLLRNLGNRWSDETAKTRLDAFAGALQSVSLGDVDGDGDTDAMVSRADGRIQFWRNDGDRARRSIRVALAARVSNRSAAGAKVEIRAGSLRQVLETAAVTPAIAPVDVTFGIGRRDAADVVRVLWPSGILQSETIAGTARIRIEELDRKPSSCPYLYTWNGARFEFVTDFLGGGEMGDWLGPGIWNQPDPDEYVRIRGDQLRPRAGRYELRVTNELEEALFLDRVKLLAIDHPQDVEIYPNEGLKEPPRPAFRLHTTRGARVPDRAVDDRGRDVRALIAERDRRWPDGFALAPIRGYAAPHALTLDLGANADRAVLLLTGWTDYAYSSDNVAASQAGLVMQGPRLEVRDARGEWRVAIPDIGFPVGRPQTVVVDLQGKWLGPSREVRIVTSMRIYWDQVLVDTSGGGLPYTVTTLDPARAALDWRGFSAESSPDDREPSGADYARVSTASPWKIFPGRYTRAGDVRDLLARTDDIFVLAGPGDEVSLSFAAPAGPRPGWRRTFLLHADGFSKEMNIRSATPDELGPLPFHAMTRYPYPPGEHYPRTPAHREYLERYNTRVLARPVPSIDAAVLAEGKR